MVDNELENVDKQDINLQTKEKELIPSPETDESSNTDEFNNRFVKHYMSSSLPALIEQIHYKDQQIDQLSKTVTTLVERNNDLQTKLLEQDKQYYRIEGNNPPPNATSRTWNSGGFFSSQQFIILIGLVIFLILSLKAFDYFGSRTYSENAGLYEKYNAQWKDYTQMTVQYQDKLEAIQAEKEKTEQDLQKKGYTIDTLTKALSRLSLQMNQEGKKSETISQLTQQLSQKEKEKMDMMLGLDSLKKALAYERKQAAELNAKNELLKEMNELKKAEADAKTSGGTSFNVLYLLIIILLSAVMFLAVDRNRKSK